MPALYGRRLAKDRGKGWGAGGLNIVVFSGLCRQGGICVRDAARFYLRLL
jgi:hypothetical protein